MHQTTKFCPRGPSGEFCRLRRVHPPRTGDRSLRRSGTKAIVTKTFPGVRDGEVYPLQHEMGGIIEGDLAEVAIDNGWAVEESNAAAGNASAGDGYDGETDGLITIPTDWAKKKCFALRSLAARIAGKPAEDVSNIDEARTIVQAEIDCRAVSPTDETTGNDGSTETERQPGKEAESDQKSGSEAAGGQAS